MKQFQPGISEPFQLLRYKKSDREEIFTFLRTVYPGIQSDRLIQQWDWKYDANPFNNQAEPYFLLLKDGDKIVGMMGSVPLRVAIHDKECWAAHPCNLVIHPDYRGRRLSPRIISQFLTDNALAFSWLNVISHRGVTSVDGLDSHQITRLVKPLKFGHIIRAVTSNRLLGRGGDLFDTGARSLIRPLRRRQTPPGVTVQQVGTFDNRVDDFWQRVRRDYPVMVVRDQRYLGWRFDSRPDAKYTLLMATRGSDLVGYLVLRLAEVAGVRLGYLVDFLVEHKSSSLLAFLVEEAVEHLRHGSAAAIICRVNTTPYRRMFYRHGFYPWRWGAPGFFHPHVGLPDPTLQDFGDVRQWFLTLGDGDLEMSF